MTDMAPIPQAARNISLPVLHNLSDIVASWAHQPVQPSCLTNLFAAPFRYDVADLAVVWRRTGSVLVEAMTADRVRRDELANHVDLVRRIPGGALLASVYHILAANLGEANKGVRGYRDYVLAELYDQGGSKRLGPGPYTRESFSEEDKLRATIVRESGDSSVFARAAHQSLTYFCKVMDAVRDPLGPVKKGLTAAESGCLNHHWTNGASPGMVIVRDFIEAAGERFAEHR